MPHRAEGQHAVPWVHCCCAWEVAAAHLLPPAASAAPRKGRRTLPATQEAHPSFAVSAVCADSRHLEWARGNPFGAASRRHTYPALAGPVAQSVLNANEAGRLQMVAAVASVELGRVVAKLSADVLLSVVDCWEGVLVRSRAAGMHLRMAGAPDAVAAHPTAETALPCVAGAGGHKGSASGYVGSCSLVESSTAVEQRSPWAHALLCQALSPRESYLV